VTEEKSESQPSKAKGSTEETTQGVAPSGTLSARLPFKNWEALKAQLVGAVRRSERLTKEDLSIRINARR
jgi:hypothetical protein